MQNPSGSDLPAPSESGFAEIDDARIQFERYEGESGLPTLIFLHEGLGSVAMWRDFPARVARATGAPVIVYSRLGYGESSPRPASYQVDYMHREARETLPKLLEYWGIERPVLVGHSDGASIALIHAAEYPLSGVAVMAPHVFVEDICIEAIEEAREAFAATNLAARLGRYHADAEHAFRGWNDIWLEPAFRDWNIEALLPAITAPVLAIQGVDDPYGTMDQLDRIERGVSGPFQRHELTACGHSPHRYKPNETLATVTEFFDRIAMGDAQP
jgi:pimeloyl-ACP methyl ester carboxylesterase